MEPVAVPPPTETTSPRTGSAAHGQAGQRANRPKRSLLAAIFLSPEESRLRAGWRLLVQSLLAFLFSLPLTLLLILGSTVLGLFNLEQLLERNPLALSLVTVPSITLATWTARRFIDRRSFRSLGFSIDSHALPDLLIGFAIPGLLFGLILAFDWGMGWLQLEGWRWQTEGLGAALASLGSGLISFIIVGFYEELLYRGYYLQNLIDGLNLGWALALSSTVFALGHLLNPNVSISSILGLVLAGLYLAYGWVRTRRLWLPIGLHIGWNFFEGTVFGYPVSGLEARGVVVQQVTGPALVTGGAFGPEAGLVVLPAMLLGTLLIYLYTRDRQPSTA